MTEMWSEAPMSPVPIPVPCGPTTVASFVVKELVRDNGFADHWTEVMRSCGHGPYFTSGTPVIGSPAMVCLGPQVETLRSGRADPTLPPMKKGKRWTRLKESAA